jgi:3-oxoacyl-[acyl-carrier-protein] synthase-1
VLRGAIVSRLPLHLIPPDVDGAERATLLLSPAMKDALVGLQSGQIQDLHGSIYNAMTERRGFARLLSERLPLLPVSAETFDLEAASGIGRCAFFDNIMGAAETLQSGRTERVLVASVDSLCATSWLMEVRDEGMLKDSQTPEGIIAGEAAGAVLLERESSARTRNAPVFAVLSSWGRATESKSWYSTLPPTGMGLSKAFEGAFSALDDNGKDVATIVTDLNGERHRALDWAYAEGRLSQHLEREADLRLPLFLSGDCGGGSGAVLLADAMGRMAFHPRFSGRIALATSDESGARRVLVLEPGDQMGRHELMGRFASRGRKNQH